MALDKRSDHIRFGSRFYIFLDWEIIEKGIGREKTHFGIAWASPRIPDVSGMLPDVSGMSGTIKTEVPLRPRPVSSSSKPPSRRLLPHLGRPRISPTKEREGDRIGEGLHQDWRPGDLDFTPPSHLFSKGTLIADLVRSTWSMHDFEIPPVNMLHWWYRSNAQSLELICDGLNSRTLFRVAGRPYQTCPVWPSRVGSLLSFDSILS